MKSRTITVNHQSSCLKECIAPGLYNSSGLVLDFLIILLVLIYLRLEAVGERINMSSITTLNSFPLTVFFSILAEEKVPLWAVCFNRLTEALY